MNRIAGIIAAVLLVLFPAFTLAADCAGLLAKAKKEFSLIRRQQLLVEALAVCPADAELNYEYGYFLERFRKYDKAVSYYRKAVSMRPGMAKAWFGIADIERSRNNLAQAREAYEKGLSLDRGNKRALARLNEVRKRLGLGPYRPGPARTRTAARPVAARKKAAAPHKAARSPLLAAITRLRVRFAPNSAELDLDAMDVLAVVVGQAMTRPELAGLSLKVVGVARDPELARKRAERVRDYLLGNFPISTARIAAAARLLSPSDKTGGVEFIPAAAAR